LVGPMLAAVAAANADAFRGVPRRQAGIPAD
jgi:hypothetical protein